MVKPFTTMSWFLAKAETEVSWVATLCTASQAKTH